LLPQAACVRFVECSRGGHFPAAFAPDAVPKTAKKNARVALGNFLLDRSRAPLLHFLTRIISEMSALRRAHPSHKPGREHPINFLPKIRKVMNEHA
jgi:hypothetical protein